MQLLNFQEDGACLVTCLIMSWHHNEKTIGDYEFNGMVISMRHVVWNIWSSDDKENDIYSLKPNGDESDDVIFIFLLYTLTFSP